jgi:hypothetical protein
MYLGGIFALIVYQVAVLSDLFNSGNMALRLSKSAMAVIGGLGVSYILINLFFAISSQIKVFHGL